MSRHIEKSALPLYDDSNFCLVELFVLKAEGSKKRVFLFHLFQKKCCHSLANRGGSIAFFPNRIEWVKESVISSIQATVFIPLSFEDTKSLYHSSRHSCMRSSLSFPLCCKLTHSPFKLNAFDVMPMQVWIVRPWLYFERSFLCLCTARMKHSQCRQLTLGVCTGFLCVSSYSGSCMPRNSTSSHFFSSLFLVCAMSVRPVALRICCACGENRRERMRSQNRPIWKRL